MNQRQKQTPLITKLQQLANRKEAPFYVPGHKKGKGINPVLTKLMGKQVFQADLPELPELDNLFAPEGVIKEAQELASEAFGADKTWFLANGSTSGVIGSILATCGEGDKIILPRNVHQSAIFGLVLSGAIPVFIEPKYNHEFDICETISAEQISDALKNHSDVKAVLLVSPTYYGICADLTKIVKVVHEYHIPIIVDEAHGAHLKFHPQLPICALEAGADLVIQSTHKVLGAMTQASMLHLQGNLVEHNRVSLSLAMVQSSSPNYLLLASLDGARQQMAIEGKVLLERTLNLSILARKELANWDYLKVLNFSQPSASFADFDKTRLTVNVTGLGISGYEADEILNQKLNVTCELPSLQNLTFIISIGNTEQDIVMLIDAFDKLASFASKSKLPFTSTKIPFSVDSTQLKLTPRQAFGADKKTVSQLNAINRISGETICPYPPGIPIIMAGELITIEAIDYLQQIVNLGGIITGASDDTLQTLLIIDD